MISKLWLLFWLGGSVIARFMPDLVDHHLSQVLQYPSFLHPFGFDAFGRDLLGVTLHASALSAAFAFFATAGALVFAVAVGTITVELPPQPRNILERILLFFLAFPSLLFALAWAAIRGPGWSTLLVSLWLSTVPSLARLALVRGRELALEDYVIASRSAGADPLHVAIKHTGPGILRLCLVKAPQVFSISLMAEASLSYLGVGVPAGGNSWGALLAQGKDYWIEAPHIAASTGLPMILTLLALSHLTESAFKQNEYKPITN